MSGKLRYKAVSLITGVIGILALFYVVLVFAGSNPDSTTIILPGLLAVVLLPIAYVTNRIGRH